MAHPKGPTGRRLARMKKVLDYRIAGLTVRQIAEELNISPTQVHRDLTDANLLTLRESADTLREIELERSELLWRRLYPLIKEGNLKAIATADRIARTRIRLMGLERHEDPNDAAQTHSLLEELLGKAPNNARR